MSARAGRSRAGEVGPSGQRVGGPAPVEAVVFAYESRLVQPA
ncbi:hypothetical protein [Kitasatospora sp. A2-31]|nr:hypothetical protein [Kitasatospora sp. A2-31]